MLFTKVIGILVTGVVASAWVIPTGSTDGLYSVSVTADGIEQHVKLRDISESNEATIRRRDVAPALTSPNEAAVLNKRVRITWCGCGFNMDPRNCDAAVEDLKNQVRSNNIPAKLAFYSIRGNVVAFVCNRSSVTHNISPDTLGYYYSRITGSCGRYIAGAWMDRPSYPAIVGYQRYANGDDFCASSTSSSSESC